MQRVLGVLAPVPADPAVVLVAGQVVEFWARVLRDGRTDPSSSSPSRQGAVLRSATSWTGLRDELLFDPRTASLLGETSVVVKPPPKYHVAPGTMYGGITYLASGIVQRVGQPGR